jgi:hypothetical protein
MTLQAQAPPRTCVGPPLSQARHSDDPTRGDPGPTPPAAAVTLPGPALPPPAPLPPAAGNGWGHGRARRYVIRFLADQDRSAVIPHLGYSAREKATAMACGSVVPHSGVASVGRAMRKLEAKGLVIIYSPVCRRQGGTRMLARLSPALRSIPAS